jgi:hypothetical protein
MIKLIDMRRKNKSRSGPEAVVLVFFSSINTFLENSCKLHMTVERICDSESMVVDLIKAFKAIILNLTGN